MRTLEFLTLQRSVNAKRYFRTVNFTHFALLLRTTYYRLFHGLLTFAFARGFLSPSRTGRFAPSRWYSPRRLGYSVSRRRSHVSGARASTATTVYTINTNLLSLFQFVSPKRNTFPATLVRSSPVARYRKLAFKLPKSAKCKHSARYSTPVNGQCSFFPLAALFTRLSKCMVYARLRVPVRSGVPAVLSSCRPCVMRPAHLSACFRPRSAMLFIVAHFPLSRSAFPVSLAS